jgi:hypothetical protein
MLYWIQVALVSTFLLGSTLFLFGSIVLIHHKLPEFKQRRRDKRIMKLAEEYRNGLSQYYTKVPASRHRKL